MITILHMCKPTIASVRMCIDVIYQTETVEPEQGERRWVHELSEVSAPHRATPKNYLDIVYYYSMIA